VFHCGLDPPHKVLRAAPPELSNQVACQSVSAEPGSGMFFDGLGNAATHLEASKPKLLPKF
jgi:hypothetical protein